MGVPKARIAAALDRAGLGGLGTYAEFSPDEMVAIAFEVHELDPPATWPPAVRALPALLKEWSPT